MMKWFIQECEMYTGFQHLPIEFEPDVASLFISILDPSLQGSLQTTIHGNSMKRFDLRLVKDWTLEDLSEVGNISFPKSYIHSIL